MPASIIAITNQKGGSGKTTTTMTLAAALGLRGLTTLVVDADPQGSALRWYTSSENYPATVVSLAGAGKIAGAVRDHVDNYDVILIDCPPTVDAPVTLSVLVIAELAILPVLPSAIDTWATEKLLAKIDEARALNPNLIVKTLLNMVRPTALAKSTIAALEDDEKLDLFPVHLSQRTAYGEAASLGVSVFATGDARAIAEANALAQQVINILGLKPRHRAPKAEKPPAGPKAAKTSNTAGKAKKKG